MSNSIELALPDIAALPSLLLEERAKLPVCTAVYFVLAEDSEVLYVGAAHCLLARWAMHHRFVQFATVPGVRIAWLAVSDSTHMLALEQYCISTLQPPYNNSPVPYRQNRWGEFCKPVVIPIPQVVYDSLQDLAFLETRSVPSYVVQLLRAAIGVLPPEKALGIVHEPYIRIRKRALQTQAPQLTLFPDSS